MTSKLDGRRYSVSGGLSMQYLGDQWSRIYMGCSKVYKNNGGIRCSDVENERGKQFFNFKGQQRNRPKR